MRTSTRFIHRGMCLLALALAAAFLPSVPGQAQPMRARSSSQELTPAGDLHAASTPAIAWNPQSGEYLVAWASRRAPGESDIRARRVSAAGAPLGDEILVDAVSGKELSNPSVACGPAGGRCLVAYEYLNKPSDGEVRARLLEADGTLVEPVINVAISPSPESEPSVAADNHQNTFVVTYLVKGDGGWHRIDARRVDGLSGGLFSTIKLIAGNSSENRGAPVAIFLNSQASRFVPYDGFLLVYEAVNSLNPSTVGGTACSLMLTNCYPTNPPTFHIYSEANGYAPSAVSGINESLVVWTDGRNILGQRVDNFGGVAQADSANFDLFPEITEPLTTTSAAFSPKYGYFTAASGPTAEGYQITARLSHPGMDAPFGAALSIASGPAFLGDPAAACDDFARCLVAYARAPEAPLGPGDQDILVRLVDPGREMILERYLPLLRR